MKLLTDAEFHAVVALDGAGRYAHFLKQVADWECVWGLRTPDGWVMAEEGGHDLVPMWPHERYAAACATGAWQGAMPDQVDTASLVSEWLPDLAGKNRRVAVFPVPSGKGVPVSPDQLRHDLEQAMQS